MSTIDTFNVERFGDDNEVDQNEENELLKKLQQKIHAKIGEPIDQSMDKKDTETSKVKPKKDRKRKGETLDIEEVSSGFTPLGDQTIQEKSKVRRVLPKWLSNPDIVSMNLNDQQMSIDQMPGLNDSLVQKLRENGLKYFFPVQRQVIPHLLHPNPFYRPADLCVSAPTGSGKTLAFVLPLVQLLSKRVVPRVRALVLLPVQDLAAQVFKVFQAYAGNHLRVKLISGQKSFAQEQMELVVATESGFHSLADIIVATPGRLVDHIQVQNT